MEKFENLHTENPKEYWNLIDKLKDGNSCNPCENIKPKDWIANFRSLGQIYDSNNDLLTYLDSTADPVHLNNIDLHFLMYADDLVILLESAKELQEKLEKLQNFCND